jgi:nucleotide-binding universal stress UspA family protein
MKEDRRRAHGELHEKASLLAEEHGVRAKGSVVEGREVQAILNFLRDDRADLLVIGPISTTSICPVFGVRFMISPRKLPCSVLGVH